MMPKKALSKKKAEAKTSVWWDIEKYPVPSGYDAGLIRQCIKREVEKLGYSGPVTISAYGDLHQIPEHVMRALSSTGIILNHSFYVNANLFSGLLRWEESNPPPGTIMFIALAVEANAMIRTFSDVSGYSMFVNTSAQWFKIIEGARDSQSCDSKQEIRRSQFILNKCSNSSESSESAPFNCKICFLPAQSFESFMEHLSCEKHAKTREYERLQYLANEEYERVRDMEMTDSGDDQASLDSQPETTTTSMVVEQPKKKKCKIMPPPKTLVEANKVKKKLKKKKKKLMKKMRTE